MQRSACTVRSAASRHSLVLCSQKDRLLSAQASAQMVDDMIQFVRTACQGSTRQALDVLQTGMAHQEGFGHDRLQLAMAEVHAADSNWAAVVEHAWPVAQQQSSFGSSPLTAQIQMHASLTCVRALLTQGKDEQATQLAQQAVKQSDSLLSGEAPTPNKQQAHLEAVTCLAGVLHATGDSEGTAAQCQTALTLVRDDDASGGVLPKLAVAAALKQAAALRLAQGQLSEAAGLFGQACAAADECQEPGSSTGLRPPVWQQQVGADVMLGAAQTAAAQHAWDKAEELLSKV
ncbi:TPA: hypothetical protein ACH3X2_003388 [Trebouxia sp. C0005]